MGDLQRSLIAEQPCGQPNWVVAESDALEWLNAQASESVDLVITDPPYSSLEKHREVGTTTRLTSQWFTVVDDHYFRPLLLQIWRILKPSCHCYIFCDQTTLPVIRDAAAYADLAWHKFLVWDKRTIGMGYHYRAQHELVCFMSKPPGCRELNDRSVPDVLSAKRVRHGYPTEKPVDLLSTLVTQSSDAGQVVVDPFCGSGSTGDASLRHDRIFRGADISAAAVEDSRVRLENVEKEAQLG